MNLQPRIISSLAFQIPTSPPNSSSPLLGDREKEQRRESNVYVKVRKDENFAYIFTGRRKKSEILQNSPNSPTYCVCCGGIGKLFSASLSDEVGKRKREGREEKATMIIFFIHGGGSLKERETDRFSLNGGGVLVGVGN